MLPSNESWLIKNNVIDIFLAVNYFYFPVLINFGCKISMTQLLYFTSSFTNVDFFYS